jgi:hypothetical protein
MTKPGLTWRARVDFALAALIIVAIWLAVISLTQRLEAEAQALERTYAPFIAWDIPVTTAVDTLAPLRVGSTVTVLKHPATGACWLILGGSARDPIEAPKEVCQ